MGQVESVNANTYKAKYQNKLAFSNIIYTQLNECLNYGTIASTNKESLRRFEYAVKMLEAVLINFMSDDHKGLIKKTITAGQDALNSGRPDAMNLYYESIRLRFMYNMQILNKVQDLVPEEKAMEYIGEEKDIEKRKKK